MSSNPSKEKDFLDELYERMEKKLELLNIKTDYSPYSTPVNPPGYEYKKFENVKGDLEIVYKFISELYNIPISELKKVKVFYAELPLGVLGTYDNEKIFLNKYYFSNSKNKIRKLLTVAHELTHYVQDYKNTFIWKYDSFDEYLANYTRDSNEKMAKYTERLFFNYLLNNGYG